ncbi:PadR family transcriptional regulator [Streptomyces sp. NBC_00838]|uniref:PadR family transcriptional regulator n=1 Tax=Streptomyces sp. NBC_00838 TaxID=2903680 RepID=UPI00386FF94E|nr:PadR family transcriptional regulator [Streptomyces sp. NBC_00838]
MSRRSGILEFAVLGLLRESPMHGYELRKRLNTSLGIFRAFSYGTLYPCLKTLVANGWLIEEPGSAPEEALAASLAGRRAKIVYRLTADGKEHFEDLLSQTGPDAWEDEHFAARFAFFGQTEREVRMRVLEGRRSRLEERLEKMSASLARTRERLDDYTLELQRHGMESVEREVRWLNELIESERAGRDRRESGPDSPSARRDSTTDGTTGTNSPATGTTNSTTGDEGGLPRLRGTSGGSPPGVPGQPDPSEDTTT